LLGQVILSKLAGYADLYLGCNAKIYGILEVWRGMDYYIVETDRLLCSPLCPCNIRNKQQYTNDLSFTSNISTWTIGNEAYNAINFQGCDREVKQLAYQQASAMSPSFDYAKDFDANRFYDFMARLEKEFDCSGWCQKSYIVNGNEFTLSKYLFTDVNRYYNIILEDLLSILDVHIYMLIRLCHMLWH
jgi:hypothetical protein